LKDRLVQSFSEANPDVESLFLDNPPPDHRDAVGRVLARCSTIPGEDNFMNPSRIEANDTDTRYKDDNGFRPRRRDDRRTKRKPITRQTSLCYVCKQPGHFARDRHSREEIDQAKKSGRTISAFVATLWDKVASTVMAAEPEDVDPETSDDSADVNLAHINVQGLSKTSDSFDVAAFNAATAKSYCEKADIASVIAQSYSENADTELVVGEACTWKHHMAQELESMVHELALG
jgi:Zinc knuckle